MAPLPFPISKIAKSGTFNAPKKLLEDSSSSLLDLYQWNATQNPDHPLFRFHDKDDIRTISWAEGVRGSYEAAILFESRMKLGEQSKSPPVVAILATTDTITYFCSIVGMLRAGFTVFPMSPRIDPEAITNLLIRAKVDYIFTSSEPAIRALAASAVAKVPEDAQGPSPAIQILSMPSFEELFPCNVEDAAYPVHTPLYDTKQSTIILHTSGSTSLPKPIVWRAHHLRQWAIAPWLGDVDLSGVVMACHGLPMFHGIGILQIVSTASCGLIMATFNPSLNTPPTPALVFEEARITKCELICTIPVFIEYWAKDRAKIDHMKTLKGVIFGGGPLSKETGDQLASHGVCLYTSYGSTETGAVSTFFPANPGLDWEYISVSKQLRAEFVPYGAGTYEMVLVGNEDWKPVVANTKIAGIDAYATKDLFVPHEHRPGNWKLYGRTDDQIILSSGDMLNPTPLEALLVQDSYVRSAVIFGHKRTGVLIEPKRDYSFITDDPMHFGLDAFIFAIWPTILRVNDLLPSDFKLVKEMIRVTSPSKPFEYTSKGTVRRQAALSIYATEIQELYGSPYYYEARIRIKYARHKLYNTTTAKNPLTAYHMAGWLELLPWSITIPRG